MSMLSPILFHTIVKDFVGNGMMMKTMVAEDDDEKDGDDGDTSYP